MSFSRSSRAANGLFRRLAVISGSAAARGVPGAWTQVRRATIETMVFWFSNGKRVGRRRASAARGTRASLGRCGAEAYCAGRYRATRVCVPGIALRRRHDRARRIPSADRASHRGAVDASSRCRSADISREKCFFARRELSPALTVASLLLRHLEPSLFFADHGSGYRGEPYARGDRRARLARADPRVRGRRGPRDLR